MPCAVAPLLTLKVANIQLLSVSVEVQLYNLVAFEILSDTVWVVVKLNNRGVGLCC
jgi:hypothetical protein